jgi:hypothetical protein
MGYKRRFLLGGHIRRCLHHQMGNKGKELEHSRTMVFLALAGSTGIQLFSRVRALIITSLLGHKMSTDGRVAQT